MQFLKTTVIGGAVFLIPLVVLVIIIGKAFAIMAKVATPLADWLPIDSVGGFALANLLAVASIILICFLAGLLARSPLAARAVESLESGILSSIPGYAFIKGMTGSLTGSEGEGSLTPVLACFDDASQIAFEVEKVEGGSVVIYLPGAPDPWAGTLMVMTADRVKALDFSMAAAVKNIRALGRGSGKLLKNRG